MLASPFIENLTSVVLLQNQRGSGVNVTEEQVFEHERFMPLAGWSSRHLLPTERNRYSRQEDGMNSTAQFPQMRLPEGSHLCEAYMQFSIISPVPAHQASCMGLVTQVSRDSCINVSSNWLHVDTTLHSNCAQTRLGSSRPDVTHQ